MKYTLRFTRFMRFLRPSKRRTLAISVLICGFGVGCKKGGEVVHSPRTEPSSNGVRQEPVIDGQLAKGQGSMSASASGSDTNNDPVIGITPFTVPENWQQMVRERYPKYIEAARQGTVPPEFDTMRVSHIEKEYATLSPDKRDMRLLDLSYSETPAAAAALARLFLSETDTDLRVQALNFLSRMKGQEQQKVMVFAKATDPAQPFAIRKNAIINLEDVETPAAKALLMDLRKDPDPRIRKLAEYALPTK